MSKDLKATDGSQPIFFGEKVRPFLRTAARLIQESNTVVEKPNNNYNQIKRLKESDSLEEFYEIFYNMLISYNQAVNISDGYDWVISDHFNSCSSCYLGKVYNTN